ncbi:hypothetical protein [Nodularia sphaerocarpa]|uniref:hypothetical protein n=1 Tax=Nodularia sphaerocarpa TaxID=137816 RepID=UPI001EFBF2D8|nr:hypothetical protein [Nodularia sphaerocarpa]MDB9371859.1 hypothetical protein [Nodularia sphaerocarpa CS-585]MDB9379896.1 hypothetical protein [Nodularia sphaerocarpa CS-585A2]
MAKFSIAFGYQFVSNRLGVKKIVGWVERSETQHLQDFVGLRLRQTTLTFLALQR